MATATERAAIGAEEGRLEGRGPVGRASEAAKNAATGRDGLGPLNRPTATERAAIGAEEGRLEGRGPVGRASEAAKNVATGRDDIRPLNRPPGAGVGPVGTGVGSGVGTGLGPDGVTDRGLMGGRHHEGLMERTEEEVARLRNRTQITHEGEAYCPNPNLRDLVSTLNRNFFVLCMHSSKLLLECMAHNKSPMALYASVDYVLLWMYRSG